MSTREILEYDVLIIGAGPSGLASAIRLKQLANKENKPLSVAVLEKGSSVGAHIVSGCLLNPYSLDELIPNWQELNFPVASKVKHEEFCFLTETKSFPIPYPKPWANISKNYIISLSELCRKLASLAEELGVEIYPGFAAIEPLFENNQLASIVSAVSGLDSNGNPTSNYNPGVEIKARQFIIAEGTRGSIAKSIIRYFNLDKDSDPQTYGLGIKEIWKVPKENYREGYVLHSLGYPLNNNAYGGGFLYYLPDNLISVGLISSLDYKNPYFSPYEEFQRFKTHPKIRAHLVGATRIEYGARVVVEGGVQALPKLAFPGGVIVGDSAGFLNVPKLKGVDSAIKSGSLAAEAIYSELNLNSTHNNNSTLIVKSYEGLIKNSDFYKELYKVRNIRPSFNYGLTLGLVYTAIDYYIFRGHTFWTFKNKLKDNEKVMTKSKFKPIDYPPKDGVITFDKLQSVYLSNLSYRENQPCHLKLKDESIPLNLNLPKYAGLEQNYCPAGVYQYIPITPDQSQDLNSNTGLNISSYKFKINALNCIHCKACDLKDPTANINWTPPEGGDGPQYSKM